MDYKCLCEYLHFAPASSNIGEPFLSLLVPANDPEFKENDININENEQKLRENELELNENESDLSYIKYGYEQINIAKKHWDILNQFQDLFEWEIYQTLERVEREYESKAKDEWPKFIVCTQKSMLWPKLELMHKRLKEHQKSNAMTKKEIKTLMVGFAKEFGIGFYDFPDPKCLKMPLIATVHGLLRNVSDKFMIWLNIHRKTFHFSVLNICEILQNTNGLRVCGDELEKRCHRTSFAKTVSMNFNGNQCKKLLSIIGECVSAMDSRIIGNGKNENFHRFFNISIVLYVEKIVKYLTLAKTDDITVGHNCPNLRNACKESIEDWQFIYRSFKHMVCYTYALPFMYVCIKKHMHTLHVR